MPNTPGSEAPGTDGNGDCIYPLLVEGLAASTGLCPESAEFALLCFYAGVALPVFGAPRGPDGWGSARPWRVPDILVVEGGDRAFSRVLRPMLGVFEGAEGWIPRIPETADPLAVRREIRRLEARVERQEEEKEEILARNCPALPEPADRELFVPHSLRGRLEALNAGILRDRLRMRDLAFALRPAMTTPFARPRERAGLAAASCDGLLLEAALDGIAVTAMRTLARGDHADEVFRRRATATAMKPWSGVSMFRPDPHVCSLWAVTGGEFARLRADRHLAASGWLDGFLILRAGNEPAPPPPGWPAALADWLTHLRGMAFMRVSGIRTGAGNETGAAEAADGDLREAAGLLEAAGERGQFIRNGLGAALDCLSVCLDHARRARAWAENMPGGSGRVEDVLPFSGGSGAAAGAGPAVRAGILLARAVRSTLEEDLGPAGGEPERESRTGAPWDVPALLARVEAAGGGTTRRALARSRNARHSVSLDRAIAGAERAGLVVVEGGRIRLAGKEGP